MGVVWEVETVYRKLTLPKPKRIGLKLKWNGPETFLAKSKGLLVGNEGIKLPCPKQKSDKVPYTNTNLPSIGGTKLALSNQSWAEA